MKNCLPSLLLLAIVPPLFAQQGAMVHSDDLARHYAAVEAELRAAPAPTDPQLAARRAAAIDLLREYRLRGDFGQNHLQPDRRVAQFVDADSRRCAVAFLLDRTGAGALTNAIAASSNLAWVAELATQPELQQWLSTNGLTAVEAARIQAPGRPRPPRGNPPPRPPARTSSFKTRKTACGSCFTPPATSIASTPGSSPT